MTNNIVSNEEVKKSYDKLILDLRKKLPNIILPSMGMLDDVNFVDIDGKDYIINENIKEE